MNLTPAAISKDESWKMFDGISENYDFLNHFLSFGQDIFWRRKLIKYLPERSNLSVLDLATGTADIPISLAKNSAQINHIIGIDLAEKMLRIGEKKVRQVGLESQISLRRENINTLPHGNESLDVVTIGFGIRNVQNPIAVLKEMYRVLRHKGRCLVLEFSIPQNPVLRAGHFLYLRTVVPFLGGLFSGSFRAYRYLNKTVESFPSGETFCHFLRQVGFQNVKANPLFGGVATIYQGDKITIPPEREPQSEP